MRSKFTLALLMVAVGCLLPGASIARALPDGRTYEMVSPVDKNGAEARYACCSSPDGERFAYYTLGNALGTPESAGLANSYLAIRGSEGWESRSMLPRVGLPGMGIGGSLKAADFSTDLSTSITLTRAVASEPNRINIFATNMDGNFNWVTSPAPDVPIVGGIQGFKDKLYAGRSADGSRIFFESNQPFSNLPGVQATQVYEWFDGQVSLVSILPDGTVPPSGAVVGDASNGGVGEGTSFVGFLLQPDAVSEDGSRVFFQAAGQLYVRENGSTTRQLSLSQREGEIGEPADDGSVFAGASADGHLAVFSSGDQLTDDATPGGGLYSFDLGTEDLRFLSSGAADPGGAQIEGQPLVSRDGSRVYFVAQGVLVPGEGVAGGHNLYVADPSGVRYITTLGNLDVQNWDNGFTPVAGRTTRATPNGRYFVFQSYEQVTNFENRGYEEIYLYDDLDGTIACVSCGEAGHVPAGDASIWANPVPRSLNLDTTQYGRPRAISDDGSRVFFQTTDDLVPEDVNDVADVYEYRRDSDTVALISAGTGSKPSEILDNSPDGRDVFFATRDSLLKRDIDRGSSDVYDAREGGGFPEPSEPGPCSGDACQRPPSGAPAADAPGTSNLHGAGNAKERSKIRRIRKLSRADKSKLAKGGSGRLRLEVSRSGTVTVAGIAEVGGESRRVVSSSADAGKAGSVTIPFALSRTGRSALNHQGSLTVALKVRFNDARPKVVRFTLDSIASKGGRS